MSFIPCRPVVILINLFVTNVFSVRTIINRDYKSLSNKISRAPVIRYEICDGDYIFKLETINTIRFVVHPSANNYLQWYLGILNSITDN